MVWLAIRGFAHNDTPMTQPKVTYKNAIPATEAKRITEAPDYQRHNGSPHDASTQISLQTGHGVPQRNSIAREIMIGHITDAKRPVRGNASFAAVPLPNKAMVRLVSAPRLKPSSTLRLSKASAISCQAHSLP